MKSCILNLRVSLLLALCLITSLSFARVSGTITTVIGHTSSGGSGSSYYYAGDGGPATSTAISFNGFGAIAVDTAGDVFVCDVNNYRIRKVNHATGLITTIGGSGVRGITGDGGPAVTARIGEVKSMCVDWAGNCYFYDNDARKIRRIDNVTGIITEVHGFGFIANLVFYVDNAGNVFFAGGSRVFKVAAGTYSEVLFAGNYSMYPGFSGDGGPATGAQLGGVGAITGDATGNIYLLDGGAGGTIRKINTSGIITTIGGGNGSKSKTGCPATNARINSSRTNFSIDAAGNIYAGGCKIDHATGIINDLNIYGYVARTGEVYYDSASVLYKAAGAYSTINTYEVTDSLVSVPCTLPIKRTWGIYGTIHGTPSSTDSAEVTIEFGDYDLHAADYMLGYYTGPSHTATHTYRLPYWFASGTYGFGSPTAIFDSFTYNLPGSVGINITVKTLDNSYDNYMYTDENRKNCSGSLTSYGGYGGGAIIFDTVVSAPCVFPVTVHINVTDLARDSASISDSMYFITDFGDSTIDTVLVPVVGIDSFYSSYTYSVYHNYAHPGTYVPFMYAIPTDGRSGPIVYSIGRGSYELYPIVVSDCSGGGRIVSGVNGGRPEVSCNLPVSVGYDLNQQLFDSATTSVSTSCHVFFGDGSDTTIVLPVTNDAHGRYFTNVHFTHTFTIPGIFTTHHYDTAGVYSFDTSVFYWYSGYRYDDLPLGASCSNVSGYFYLDSNSNCSRGASERRLSYWPYAVVNNTLHDTTYGWCDDSGKYRLNLISGDNYTIVSDPSGIFHYGPSIGATLLPSCPSTGIFTLTATTSTSVTHDFAFTTAAPTSMDMSVSGWGWGFIPGDTGVVGVWSSNPWGFMIDTLSADVTLTIDSALTYIGMWSGPAPTAISGHTLTWHFATHDHLFDFNAFVKVVCDTTLTITDVLHNTAYVTPTRITDPYMVNNLYQWTEAVTTSWDPNEKEVSPKGYGPQGYIENGTPLSYIIHFQNTGNARARNITVVDTLSEHLDLSTMQVINSSFPVSVYQLPGNIIKFRLNNILLPDSSHGEDSSSGFIAYNIIPKDSLAPNTRIINSASIYFDYNPGVLTNATLNTIEDTVGVVYGADSVCIGTTTALSNHIAGGEWSVSNTHATISTAGLVTGITPGYDTITYTVYGHQSVTKVLYVKPYADTRTFSSPASVCVGGSITITPSVSGGTWAVAGSSASVAAGVVAGVSAGADTVFYTIPAVCGNLVAVTPVAVQVFPSVGSITGSGSLCSGFSTTLAAGISGGVWSSGGTVATVSGGIVTGVAVGTDTVVYSITNSCGTAAAHFAVTVSASPIAGTILGATTVCEAATITLTATAPGGTWSCRNPAASVSGGVVTGVASGIDTVVYTVTNGCGSTYASKFITINPAPEAGTFTGSTICVGASATLTVADAGGTWGNTAPSVASVNASGIVTGIGTGSATISYLVVNSCGADTATANITVDAELHAGTISGLDSMCSEGDLVLIGASTGGSWMSSNPSIATVTATGHVTASGVGICSFRYAVGNICGTDTALHTVYFKPASGCTEGVGDVAVAPVTLGIFPNPNTGIFTIDVPAHNNDAVITILNVHGQLIRSVPVDSKKRGDVSIDISNMSKGVYMVKVEVDNVFFYRNVIVL